jgi:hypothetical protein
MAVWGNHIDISQNISLVFLKLLAGTVSHFALIGLRPPLWFPGAGLTEIKGARIRS